MQYYADSNIYRYEHGSFLGRFGGFNILNIVNKDFEIVQKQDEIDIDNIEEMKLDVIDDVTYYINDLTKAVKQLNREIKKLKENK